MTRSWGQGSFRRRRLVAGGLITFALTTLTVLGYTSGASLAAYYYYCPGGGGYGYCPPTTGTLIVVKHVVNSTTSSASDFAMTINGVTAEGGNSFPGAESPGTDKVVNPGTYNVTESPQSGFDTTFSAGCAGTISAGETKTCTVTNVDVVVATLPAGGTIESGAPTPENPVQTALTTPNAGEVTIDGQPISEPSPSNYTFIGQQVEITAPDATPSNPLSITFNILGAVLVANGLDYTTVQVFRNGVLIKACNAGAIATGNASPNPCVSARSPFPLPSGLGASITVRTSQASIYNFGVRAPFTVSGYFAPVRNAPTLNTANAGSGIPLKFSLGGDQGLDIFAFGYPLSVKIACTPPFAVDNASLPAMTSGSSVLTFDLKLGQYIFSWKTDKSWASEPAGPCRQIIARFISGQELKANFKFVK